MTRVEKHEINYKENLFRGLSSEKSLAKDWNSREDEKAWKKLEHKK